MQIVVADKCLLRSMNSVNQINWSN